MKSRGPKYHEAYDGDMYIVVFIVPNNALNNLSRPNVKDRKHVMYRADMVFVKEIIGADGTILNPFTITDYEKCTSYPPTEYIANGLKMGNFINIVRSLVIILMEYIMNGFRTEI